VSGSRDYHGNSSRSWSVRPLSRVKLYFFHRFFDRFRQSNVIAAVIADRKRDLRQCLRSLDFSGLAN
ncbi:hypothetical protein LUI62_43000, partial [Bradyrhizobium diazoefficiens]|uniref:hypothetical protein n=1 Tax=Bradyrhizobium diazoefficiens TaxID=1355477 RepID=UPI001E2BDD1C